VRLTNHIQSLSKIRISGGIELFPPLCLRGMYLLPKGRAYVRRVYIWCHDAEDYDGSTISEILLAPAAKSESLT